MTQNLNEIFMAEASDLMADLEKDLMDLESNPSHVESINKVFRVMHTLKGSASMFGFDPITAITHELETIYDSIRNGEKALSTEILKATFETLDHLKHLLADPKLNDMLLKQKHQELLSEIGRLVAAGGHSQSITNATEKITKGVVIPFYILFSPHLNVLRHGTNTLYLIEDLLSLGEGIVLPFFKDLPTLETIEPLENFTGFEIILKTDKSELDIREVFMFVETECDLEIRQFPISSNFLLSKESEQQIQKLHKSDAAVGFNTLQRVMTGEPKAERHKKTAKEKIAEALESKGAKTFGGSIRVGSERIEELMNLVSELVTTQASLTLYAGKIESNGLSAIAENVEKITRRLRDNAFTMSLIPIESLVVRFQRLVRDLSKELNKDIVFKTEGTETEIDKSIIEKLTDPLLHLLRNSLDHGIEAPDERVSKGKPKQGTLLLKSFYSGASVIIQIIDDGAGINLEKVKSKAISKGLIAADAVMDESEITNLIFMPGFSTADQVTGVSGRGVGMDVVRRNISDIRGDIEIITKQSIGTTFSIRLPLTLSIIDGLLVRIGETDFILPLTSVHKCYEVETKALHDTFNQWVTLEGHRIPFIYLRKDFNINQDAPDQTQIIKVAHEGHYVGLAVDRIVGEYQAVLKPLGSLYQGQDEFSGATILGDGTVALVVDPYRLVKKLVDVQQLHLKAAS
jgi:two-component system, chemotaxis family, sensor kinase CheA